MDERNGVSVLSVLPTDLKKNRHGVAKISSKNRQGRKKIVKKVVNNIIP